MPIRVSIVEDDQPARDILTGWLVDAADFEFVSAFGSGEDGLLQLPTQKPDVVLMDIKLPGLSGVECVRQLKPVLSAAQYEQVESAARQSGPPPASPAEERPSDKRPAGRN